jgi:MFS family permease
VSGPDAGPAGGALKIPRSFLVFWTARTLSWTGTGISGVVLPVLIYDRTGSAALTTLLAAAEAVPYLALGLVAGAVADRSGRRGLMVGCDLGCAALMASIPLAWALGGLSTGLVWRRPGPRPRSCSSSRRASARCRRWPGASAWWARCPGCPRPPRSPR